MSTVKATDKTFFRSLTPIKGQTVNYSKRDLSSRAASRDSRFGETDITGRGSYMSNAPMTLVSNPLNMRGTVTKGGLIFEHIFNVKNSENKKTVCFLKNFLSISHYLVKNLEIFLYQFYIDNIIL